MTNKTYEVADLFCGAGGSSTGAKRAIEETGGEMNLVAVNHWAKAIDTHSRNHPDAHHIIEDLNLVDPERVVENGYLDILMASPECRFYSKARGGKPVHDQGRMNPWTVINWLTRLNVRCVLIENVPEFVHWGPLGANGKPDKTRKGEHFQAWFLTFLSLGYEAQWRMLNAADYGDATTRVRFFLVARKDGIPIRWPEPTHAQTDNPMFPGRLPWRGANEIINWDNPGRSLLDDPKYWKKPLSVKTRRRIAKGLQRFGGGLAHLYVRLLDLPDEQPDGRNEHPVPNGTNSPFTCANRNNNAPRGEEDPIATVTANYGGGNFAARPEMKPFVLGQQSGGAARDTEDPVPTVTGDGAIPLIRPHSVRYQRTSQAHAVEDPSRRSPSATSTPWPGPSWSSTTVTATPATWRNRCRPSQPRTGTPWSAHPSSR